MEAKRTDILLVEDNPGDVLLTRKALEEVCVGHCLHVAQDGLEALDFLKGPDAGQAAHRPDLILLDLNLPRMSGQELIQHLTDMPALQSVPLVVLTSSAREQHVLDGWQPRRHLYLVKPSSFTELLELFRHVMEFLDSLPSPGSSGNQRTG